MNSFRAWYLRNQVQITWFVVGWLGLSTISSLAQGDYVNATIAALLVAVNLILNKKSV